MGLNRHLGIAASLLCYVFVCAAVNLTITEHKKDVVKDFELKTVLDNWVWNKGNEHNYSYTVLSKKKTLMGTVYVLKMISQTWLTKNEVSERSEWFHYIQIIVPIMLKTSLKESILVLDMADNNIDPNSLTEGSKYGFLAAVLSRSIYSTIYSIPNQPIVFQDDPQQRSLYEDQIVAYTWKHYILNYKQNKEKAAEWVVHLPMTKAAIKAMDTLQEFLKKELSLDIEKFTVGGHSKRGWIAWLAASVDPNRIRAIIPLVIPILNSQQAFARIYDNICKWPEALSPYVVEGVTNYFNTKEFVSLTSFIDPLVYKDRYMNIDKYLLYALGDELFSPDLSTFSYSQLDNGNTDHKFIRYVPNVGHRLDENTVLSSFNFYIALVNNADLPKYTFTQSFESNGARLKVTILNNKQPNAARLWQATNTNARDFRLGTIGPAFKSSDLSAIAPYTYEVFVPNPPTGYTAFTIELEFKNGYPAPLIFTTSAYITPNAFPCHLEPPPSISSHRSFSSKSNSNDANILSITNLFLVLYLTLCLLG